MQQSAKRGVKARRQAARNTRPITTSSANVAATMAPRGNADAAPRVKAAQRPDTATAKADIANDSNTIVASTAATTASAEPVKPSKPVAVTMSQREAAIPTTAALPKPRKNLSLALATSAASSGSLPGATSVSSVKNRATRSFASVVTPDQTEQPVPKTPAYDTHEHETSPAAKQAGTPAFLLAAWDWLRGRSVEQWLWFGILVLATVLRFWGLGDKPLHHDESMHAYFSLSFAIDPSGYRYDPLLHGPFQFHAEAFMFLVLLGLQHVFVHGVAGNPWINDATARIVPALFGLGIVVLPLGLRRELGRYGALAAAFFLAVSPSFVYFSRFLREDIYFNFFMFAMVVCAVRFAQSREMRWFIGLFAATILAYATFEGTYMTLAIFGSFLAVVLVWELAYAVAHLLPQALTTKERLFFSRALLLTLLGAIGGALALVGERTLNNLSNYINNHQGQADVQVQNLENISVAILLYASIFIALWVIGTLLWQMFRDDVRYNTANDGDDFASDEDFIVEDTGRPRTLADRADSIFNAPSRWASALRQRLDPQRQSFLSLVFSTNWIYWFVAFVVAWLIFAALYWIIPGSFVTSWGDGFQQGIGRGLWQGLYYWIEQQNVARGGQPWYYYLLLIPMYEQLAVVFGPIGIVYALMRPTRFRLFLVWWFVLSLGLYSWAGEKMPWLTIHIILPLMLLAGLAVGKALEVSIAYLRQLRLSEIQIRSWKPGLALAGVVGAALLLIPMVHGMLVLTHQDAADGPHEMMVYVQTTNDVDSIMTYINHADQVLYHGQHKLRIAIGTGEEWPFYWYLRDYSNMLRTYTTVYWDYPAGDPSYVAQHPVDVLLLYPAGDQNGADAQTFMTEHPTGYQDTEYKLRSWWDEGYKPLPCVQTKTTNCPSSQFLLYGDGLGNYLTYGKMMPSTAKFNPFTAAGRLWSWLWQRTALGDVNGSYDVTMIVRSGMPTPLPAPLHEQP